MPVVTLGRVLDAEWVAGWAVAWAADLEVVPKTDRAEDSVVGLAGDPGEGLAVAAVADSAGEIAK